MTGIKRGPVPPRGVWCPAVTFFDPTTGDLDLRAQLTFFHYLSRTGLAGLIILGTNAETFLLTREERVALVKCARAAVPASFPLVVGVSGHSTKQVLEYIADAVDSGADYGLLLPPSYFGKATTEKVIEGFYDEIATKSQLPIVIYNFPGVCNGIDLSSKTITALALRHPEKIVGVKLTCGSVAKIVRLTAVLSPDRFATFGGQSDFLIGGLAAGSSGCVAAFANIFPRTICKIYSLWTQGNVQEALELQRTAALSEESIKSGIAAVKFAVSQYSAKEAGIDEAREKLRPRKPYFEVEETTMASMTKAMDGLAELERSLPLKKIL